MQRRAARADFLDASALVKVFTDEPCSDIAREYFRSRPTKYTTPFCFYEAMNVLKGKWKYRLELTLVEYLDAAHKLTLWYGLSSARVKDLDFTAPSVFLQAKEIAQRSHLDLSDAFQVLSVKNGYFSVLANDSATVLVTADKALAAMARAEGLRAWDLVNESPPP